MSQQSAREAASGRGSGSLVVACEPGDDGGLQQRFFLEVFQAEQGQLWANLSTATTISTATAAAASTSTSSSSPPTSATSPASSSAKGGPTVVEFTVSGLPLSSTFVLVLYAANGKGRSNYVTLSASTAPPGCCPRGSEFLKFTADIGIKPLMYILATVVGGLVVAAIAIVTLSRARTINRAKGTTCVDAFLKF